jgi:hypothetical protein
MSDALRRIARRVPLALMAAGALAGCRHNAQPVAAPPALPPQQLVLPAPAAAASMPVALTPDTAREAHVDVDTHNRDEDVRPLLDFVARAGNFSLVYPANLNRKVRVTLNDVPASVALQALLALADLQLEPTTPGAHAPSRPSVVFYELPVNVDSLSVDAIMKRFGVGRTIAEMIVKSRSRP